MRLLALIAALGISACIASPEQAAFEAGGLDGEWRIVSLNGRPVAGALSLDQGRMTVNFGCNLASESFRIAGGRLVPATGMAVTEMACRPADPASPDPMALEAEGFRIVSRPMWIAGTRENRRLRLWNEHGWLLADYRPTQP